MAALKNKLGITDSTELAREEERISKRKAAEMFESGMLDEMIPGSYRALQAIHNQLFCDVMNLQVKLEQLILQKEIFDLHQSCIWMQH